MVNYSRIIGEVMVLMEKPSVSESPSGRARGHAPYGILQRQKLAAAEKWLRCSPDFFGNIWEFIGARSRSGDLQGAHKVYGELLTHHRRGHGVDGEAFRVRIPLRQGTRTCPIWDLAETEACGGGKVITMLPWFFWEYLGIYRRKI